MNLRQLVEHLNAMYSHADRSNTGRSHVICVAESTTAKEEQQGPTTPAADTLFESTATMAITALVDCILAHAPSGAITIAISEKKPKDFLVEVTLNVNDAPSQAIELLANNVHQYSKLYHCQTLITELGSGLTISKPTNTSYSFSFSVPSLANEAPAINETAAWNDESWNDESWNEECESASEGANESANESEAPTHVKHPNFSGIKLLMVEDNHVNQQVNIALLEPTGITYTIAHNGLEAVEIITSGQVFDVILMDTRMPVMDGLEATRQIRLLAAGSQVPIIALTANALESDITDCIMAGMNDHVSKPIHAEVLFQCLSNWVKTKHDIDNTALQNIEDTPPAKPPQEPVINLSSIQFIAETPDLVKKLVSDFVQTFSPFTMCTTLSHEEAQVLCSQLNDHDLCLSNPTLQQQVNRTLEYSSMLDAPVLLKELGYLISACEKYLESPISTPPSTHGIAIEGFDCDAAIARLSNRPDRYLKILNVFLKNNTNTAKGFENEISENNWEEAQRTAHSAKGLAATIGANRLQEAALQAEQEIKQSNGLSEKTKNEFKEAFDVTISLLQNYLN